MTRLRRSPTELVAVLSPIHQLPPEVLAKIFLYASDGSSVVWPRRNGDVEMPLLLGRICNYWRTITHSSPLLWSNLRLNIPRDLEIRPADSLKCTCAAVRNLVDICLSRSRNIDRKSVV